MGDIEHRRTTAIIAQEIRREVDAAEADFESAVQHAIRAGELLTEAKAQVNHGEWLPWLAQNFAAGARTAQNYMRLAGHAEDAQRVAHLGIGAALKQLAAPKPQEDAQPPDGLAAHEARAEAGLVAFARAMRQIRDSGDYPNAGEDGAWQEHCADWGHTVTSMNTLIQRFAPVPVLSETDVKFEAGKAAWLILSDDQRREVVERAAHQASQNGDRLDAARLYLELAESYGTPAPWEDGEAGENS